jgi:hypothetical protein
VTGVPALRTQTKGIDTIESVSGLLDEAEISVLGAMMLDERGADWAIDHLRRTSFRHYENQLIYDAIKRLKTQGVFPDPLLVCAALDEQADLPAAGGRDYLARIVETVPTAVNLKHHAAILKRAERQRRHAELAGELTRRLNGGEPVAEVLPWGLAQLEESEPTAARPVDLRELLRMEMPPREWLVQGFLQRRDLAMLHAFRGTGKSRFLHGLAVAVASGGSFLRWRAPEPAGVLLVDGELPREDLQAMLAQAVAALDVEPIAPLRILSADLADAPVRSLATATGRERVASYLSDDIEFLILDAIGTLCPGSGRENESESWEAMQDWLLELRRSGITVLFAHHDGKGGSQRGTSKREDVLSQVLQLKRPLGYQPSEGARFEVHFTKSRGLLGTAADPIEAWLRQGPDDSEVWTWKTLEDTQAAQAQVLAAEGLTQREIAAEMGVGLATVNRALKRAREQEGAA